MKTKTTMVPFFNRVLVEPDSTPDQTESGLFIPTQAKEKPMRGTVISVGAGRILNDGRVYPCAVKVGDKVLFGKHAGTKVIIDGKEILMFVDDDLFCQLIEEPIEDEAEAPTAESFTESAAA